MAKQQYYIQVFDRHSNWSNFSKRPVGRATAEARMARLRAQYPGSQFRLARA